MIFDGAGNHRLFDVMASQHHIFDGLTIRNTDVAIFAGQKEVLGAVGLTVKNCRFENVGFGVWTEYAGSSDFYIADNLFLGRDDRFRLIGWTGPLWASAGAYGSHLLTSYYAIKVYGPGHVIAHNAIAYFHDGDRHLDLRDAGAGSRAAGLVDRHLQQRHAHARTTTSSRPTAAFTTCGS